MAIGAITEIVNASELNLNFGGDIYIMLTNLQIHIGRTEDRVATTDAGALYTYGKGENFFTATLVMTIPEMLDTNSVGFNKLSQIDGDGDMPTRAWLITGTQVNGGDTVEWACTGVLKEYDVRKNPEGKVEIDIFVRITGDTVAVT
jgi:hypothetical protein